MINKKLIFSFLFLINIWIANGQHVFAPEITAADIQAHISFLAGDELGGRYTGSTGSQVASEYIRQQFLTAGLRPAGDNGFQNFEVVVNVSAGDKNALSVNGGKAASRDLFTPFPFSQDAIVGAGVVFVGYGFDIGQDSLKWQDYEGVDVAGKWVMMFRGDPEMDKQESRFEQFGDDRDKVLTARDHGASGVLMVSGTKFDKDDDLVPMIFDKTQSNAGIPVIHIKRALADEILASTGLKIEELESSMITRMLPNPIVLKASVKAQTEVVHEKVMARNVVAILQGSDPALNGSYIVIGAHYDHLGMGGPGSGSRFMDSLAIHNGADDNASGVAGVLEMAAALASDRSSLKRSIVFVAFDAEELGLLGSKYFVENPPVSLNSVMAMINFDMIGRLKDDSPAIMISGVGTAKESVQLLDSLDNGRIQLNYTLEGFGPSDHAAFYAEEIPVYFITTGAHEDYHTPDDDWDRINFAGEAEVLTISQQLARELASRAALLTFQEAGPKEQQGRGGYRFKVTLGIMPDFASATNGGLGVGGVKKDGPAYKGGILKGDVITAMDGKPVNDIYDYMNRLKKLQPGQVISVDVMRNGEKKVLIIQL
jgi:hypothetical protein